MSLDNNPEYMQPEALAAALDALGTDLAREAAQRLRYFDGQDMLLNRAQDEIASLSDSLQEIRRPMAGQMARQNKTIEALNVRLMWFASYVAQLKCELKTRGGPIPEPLIADPGMPA